MKVIWGIDISIPSLLA